MRDITQEEFVKIQKDFDNLIQMQKMKIVFDPSPKSNRTLELMQDIQKNLHFIQPK
jgi:capsule polysaccharide export protein KpsE/RkpR